MRGIGLDFGTTNSALAVVDEVGPARLAQFATGDGPTPSFRSVLFFGREEREDPLVSSAGPRALAHYLEIEGERRLMQSLKSFLASRLFTSTNLFGRRTSLEELIGRILSALWAEAAPERNEGTRLVVGRPVRFAKAREAADDQLATERLGRALRQAGIEDLHFEYEPVAAAYHYEQDLEHDELVLIADFGGGTSDFCLLRVGPSWRGRRRDEQEILGTQGVAVAGDAFDAKLVRHLIAPRLGRGSRHDTLLGREVPVPNWIYADLERWHHLSFLRSPRTLSLLHEIRSGASERGPIDALLHVVEQDLGFQLYQAVERTKTELSHAEETQLCFENGPVQIAAPVRREEFEAWIADELSAIEACVDRLLAETATPARAVDRVFLTGGSSFVPAVRRVFERRFGGERVRSGGELISVASGLALRARDLASSAAGP